MSDKRVKDGQDKEEEGKKEEKARGQSSKASFSTIAVKAFEVAGRITRGLPLFTKTKIADGVDA